MGRGRRFVIAHLIGIAALAAAVAQPAFAQTPASPLVDVSGGISFLTGSGDNFPRLTTSKGFQVGVAAHLNKWFGVFADLGGHFSTVTDLGPGYPASSAETSVHEFLFGPRFTFRSGRAGMFVHGLFGVAKGHTNIGFSDSALAFGGGGGADVDLTARLAVRGQLDMLGSFADIMETATRFSVTLVARFGSRQ